MPYTNTRYFVSILFSAAKAAAHILEQLFIEDLSDIDAQRTFAEMALSKHEVMSAFCAFFIETLNQFAVSNEAAFAHLSKC